MHRVVRIGRSLYGMRGQERHYHQVHPEQSMDYHGKGEEKDQRTPGA